MPLKYIVYSRVSTEAQVDNSSLASQESLAREWADSQGWEYVETVRDQGSRDTLDRSNTARLFELLGDGAANVVVLYRVDRAGGSQEVFLRLFGRVYGLEATIAIAEKRQHYESLLDLMADSIFDRAISEHELLSIRRRTSQGTIAHMERGGFVTVPLFGYKLVREAREGVLISVPVIDNEPAKLIAYIFSEVGAGTPLTTLCKTLNDRGIPGPKSPRWNETSLRNIVGRYGEKYSGQPWVYTRTIGKTKKMSVEYRYPPIVSFDDVLAARAMLKSRRGGRPESMPFRGLIQCSRCGRVAAIRPIKRSGSDKVYLSTVCNSYSTTHAYRSRGIPVDFEMCRHYLSLRVITERLIEWIKGEGEDSLERGVVRLQAHLIAFHLKQQLEEKAYREAERKRKSVIDKILDATGDEYRGLRGALNDQLLELDETMEQSQCLISKAQKDEKRIRSAMKRLGVSPVELNPDVKVGDALQESNTASLDFNARVGELTDALDRMDATSINSTMRALGIKILVDYGLPAREDRAESVTVVIDPEELAGLSLDVYEPFSVPSGTQEAVTSLKQKGY